MALFTGHPITDDSAIGGSVIERSLVNAEGRSRYLTYTPSTAGIATVNFDSTYFKFPSGGTPALPITSGAISLVSFTVHKAGAVGVNTVLLAGASVNFS